MFTAPERPFFCMRVWVFVYVCAFCGQNSWAPNIMLYMHSSPGRFDFFHNVWPGSGFRFACVSRGWFMQWAKDCVTSRPSFLSYSLPQNPGRVTMKGKYKLCHFLVLLCWVTHVLVGWRREEDTNCVTSWPSCWANLFLAGWQRKANTNCNISVPKKLRHFWNCVMFCVCFKKEYVETWKPLWKKMSSTKHF